MIQYIDLATNTAIEEITVGNTTLRTKRPPTPFYFVVGALYGFVIILQYILKLYLVWPSSMDYVLELR